LKNSCFQKFPDHIVEAHQPPEIFNFPFYYEPHPLAIFAAESLQHYLETQTDFKHNFGLIEGMEGLEIGKMFGVLVVENEQKELGYLTAFSGKLAGVNHLPRFVPPIYDMLEETGYFRQEEIVLTNINARIEELESAPAYIAELERHNNLVISSKEKIAKEKEKMKREKKERKRRRVEAETLMEAEAYEQLKEELKEESILGKFIYREYSLYLDTRVSESQNRLEKFQEKIDALKQERKVKSSALQQWLFDQYNFLNIRGQVKNVRGIFENTVTPTPPAGSGECAAPKLLQYAFQHKLKPLCMAEFWWGKPLKGEIRKKGHYYPACRGKCEPILAHMLDGISVEENPMLTNPAEGKTIPIVYEDDYIVAINKPAEFLSVPGKLIIDSVYERMRLKYPDATGPLIVHRLDMSTSGIMLIAKDKGTHKSLQTQFIKRRIKKRYVALLDGILEEAEGIIDLPLRVDLDNRPHQMVCYDHGKNAQTKWERKEEIGSQTKVHFFPITGRTHQLRVHASHPSGLNAAIVGDDLYGKRADRLHLHADRIEFWHHAFQKHILIEVEAPF